MSRWRSLAGLPPFWLQCWTNLHHYGKRLHPSLASLRTRHQHTQRQSQNQHRLHHVLSPHQKYRQQKRRRRSLDHRRMLHQGLSRLLQPLYLSWKELLPNLSLALSRRNHGRRLPRKLHRATWLRHGGCCRNCRYLDTRLNQLQALLRTRQNQLQ